jgi:integrase
MQLKPTIKVGRRIPTTNPRTANRLTVSAVRNAKVGRHGDGNGLSLIVTAPDRKHWQFRYMRAGKGREMSLGNAAYVTLAEARQKAQEAHRLLAQGVDPLDQRHASNAVNEPTTARSFAAVAEQYISAHQVSWRNEKHKYQWRQSLASYAYPVIGDMDVAAVEMEHVLAALHPIWTTKTETASRLRGRIETILAYSIVSKWRVGPNPATWRGNLQMILPAPDKVARLKHHAALPWQEMPAFMAKLCERDSIGGMALRFTILTAARSGEARGARWSEIDLEVALWTVPGTRMKAGKPHRVPLSDAACNVLRAAAKVREDEGPTALVFPGLKRGEPMSDMTMGAVLKRMGRADLTVHGMRSSFRDWAAEATDTANHVVEQALAHAIGSGVEAAYRRGDLFEKRRALMRDWAAFCDRRSGANPNGSDIRGS